MDPPLPDGWERIPDGSGKFYYLTRRPQVKIVLKSQLQSYHDKGRYLEMLVSDLDFGTKTRTKRYAVAGGASVVRQPPMDSAKRKSNRGDEESRFVEDSVSIEEPDEMTKRETEIEMDNIVPFDMEYEEDIERQNHTTKKESKLDKERMRLENAVRKLTLNPDKKVDHESDLKESAQLLNEARNMLDNTNIETVDLDAFKASLLASRNIQEVLQSLKSCPQLQLKISSLEQSKLLEQMLKISTMPDK